MKIVHLSTAESWRGGEQQIAYLIDELLKLGVEQELICKKGSEIEQFAQRHQIPFQSFVKNASISFSYTYGIIKTIKTGKADILHAHDSHAHTATIIAILFSRYKTPVVLSRRVDFPVSNNFFSRFKYNHQSIKSIICVSRKIAEVLKPAINQHDKIKTIYSGIDFKRFSPQENNNLRNHLNLNDDTKLIGNIAALADHKDYFTFVDAASKILDKGLNAHFVIIGDGPMKKEIEAYIEGKKLTHKISMLGFRDDIHTIIYDLDVMLFTSKTEGLGSSILDAMYAGVPVVATKAGGIPEIITHDKNGLLAPVKDANSLAELVITLCTDENKKQKIIQNAKESVLGFSKQHTAQQTMQVYESVLSNFESEKISKRN